MESIETIVKQSRVEGYGALDIEEMAFYLKSKKVDERIYNKTRDLYMSQLSFTDRILIFSNLISTLLDPNNISIESPTIDNETRKCLEEIFLRQGDVTKGIEMVYSLGYINSRLELAYE